MPGTRAVFLDRDGTLNEDVGYTYKLEDFRLLEGVVEGLRALADQGFRLFVFTNQSGIARGYYTEEQMHAFNRRMQEELAAQGVRLEGFYFCPFHPTRGVGPYRRESSLRKPAPGMLLRAADEHGLDLARSYVVGDKKSDIAAGKAAGCATVLVRTGYAGAGEPDLDAVPDYTARDLVEAAGLIAEAEGARP